MGQYFKHPFNIPVGFVLFCISLQPSSVRGGVLDYTRKACVPIGLHGTGSISTGTSEAQSTLSINLCAVGLSVYEAPNSANKKACLG